MMLWEIRLDRCLELTGKTPLAAATDLKSAAWKVAIGAHMNNRLMCSNGWLAEKLRMGALHGVNLYVGETLAGKRPKAEKLTLRLNARIKE